MSIRKRDAWVYYWRYEKFFDSDREDSEKGQFSEENSDEKKINEES